MAQNIPDITDERNCITDSSTVTNGSVINYTWDGAVFCWDDASMYDKEFCWDDVRILYNVLPDDGSGEDIMAIEENYRNLEEGDKKRFITLTCRVRGYPETTESKEKVEKSLTAKDIQFTIDEVFKAMKVKIKG